MLGGKKSSTEKPCETIDTLVGPKSEVIGDIAFSGGLRIDGKVKGNISAGEPGNSTLVVSELGEVDGSVDVPYLIVNGTIKGTITCSGRVELQPNARITADIHYKALEMSAGASVSGAMVCDTGNSVANLKAVPTGEAAITESEKASAS